MFALVWLAASLGAPGLTAKPCDGENAGDPSVNCATLRVPEDWARPNERTIGLNVLVLRAISKAPDLPALIDIDGGPGLASTRSATFYRTDGLAYRQRRDVILVDQRGTGGSNPLACPELASPAAALDDMYPPDKVAACRRDLERDADLTQYGTSAAVRDLEAVRTALGHRQVDIVAISYGTTVALRYMAAYPDHVRAAVLFGVVPASAMPPRLHSVAAQRGLDLLFADCAADAACKGAYPTPSEDLAKAIRWLESNPGTLSKDVFLEKIRTWLYRPDLARRTPHIVQRAASGDFSAFRALAQPSVPSPFADGMYLSITCSESLAAMDYENAARNARATRFGDYRLRRQREACAAWPTAHVAPSFFKPVTTRAAVLLISGGRDPVTPGEWAEDVARDLPNARHLTIPAAGHGLDGLSNVESCYDPLIVRFLETAVTASVDATCFEQMRPPPFTQDHASRSR